MRVLKPGARIVFINVWPVLKSLPPIGTPLRVGELDHAREIAAQVRCAVGVGHVALERGVRVDLARADLDVAVPEPLLERLDALVHRAGLAIRLGRSAPHHHEPVATVLGSETLDVGHQRLGQLHLVGARLDAEPVEAGDPLPVEDRVHRDDAFHARR